MAKIGTTARVQGLRPEELAYGQSAGELAGSYQGIASAIAKTVRMTPLRGHPVGAGEILLRYTFWYSE
jgi:hypothetical protein